MPRTAGGVSWSAFFPAVAIAHGAFWTCASSVVKPLRARRMCARAHASLAPRGILYLRWWARGRNRGLLIPTHKNRSSLYLCMYDVHGRYNTASDTASLVACVLAGLFGRAFAGLPPLPVQTIRHVPNYRGHPCTPSRRGRVILVP